MKINLNISLFFLVVIIITHALALTKLMFFPYPELFVYPYLTNQGLLPYKQILDQHFPGLMFFPINFDNLGMVNDYVARIWLIGLVILTHTILFLIGSKIFKSSKKAILANFFYLFWQPFLEGWVFWIDSFLPLFYLPAFYFTYKSISDKKDQTRSPIMSGFFLGLALVFKQVALPPTLLVFLLLFFYTKSKKILLNFIIGFLPLPLIMILYIWNLGVLEDFWYWTVVFNLTVFAQFGGKGPSFISTVKLLVIYSPLILLPFTSNKKLISTLLVFAVGVFASSLNRFDLVHFQPSLPFIGLTFSVIVFTFWKKNWFKIVLLSFVLISFGWIFTFYKGHLNKNVLYFDSHTTALAEYIKDNTNPGEHIFILGYALNIYPLSQTIPAGDVFVFQFPWFMMIAKDKLLEGIEKDKPKIIIRDDVSEIEGRRVEDFAKDIIIYTQENYREVNMIGPYKIFQRRDSF